MEEGQSILDATEYILIALNNIKNYKEFIEYKEEIAKAIDDIRNSIINLMNMKKYNYNNLNVQQEGINQNNINLSSISSKLGLKFNYDAYLKDIPLNNFYQNEQIINSDLNQENKNDNNLNYINNDANNILNNEVSINNLIISKNTNNSTNKNKMQYNEDHNKNNLAYISFKDSNDYFETSQNKEENIAYNKSIRNQFKINNNFIDNKNTNKYNNIVNKKNNNMNPSKENNYKIQSNQDINNNQKGVNKKEKLSLIADIIMKINSEDYFYEILTKLFGDDLTDKLMSSEVNDELLEAVQNSIKEIEELKKKDDLKNQINNNNINKKNSEEIEDQPKRFPIEQIMNPNVKQNMNRSNSNKKLKNEKNNNNYQEFNFQKNLRNDGRKDSNDKNSKKSSSKKEKPFISATNAYGNYFDPPLQRGGMSKLDDYKK